MIKVEHILFPGQLRRTHKVEILNIFVTTTSFSCKANQAAVQYTRVIINALHARPYVFHQSLWYWNLVKQREEQKKGKRNRNFPPQNKGNKVMPVVDVKPLITIRLRRKAEVEGERSHKR